MGIGSFIKGYSEKQNIDVDAIADKAENMASDQSHKQKKLFINGQS